MRAKNVAAQGIEITQRCSTQRSDSGEMSARNLILLGKRGELSLKCIEQ